MKKIVFALAAGCLSTCFAALPAPQSAAEARDALMRARHAAQSLGGAQASPDQLRQAAQELEALRAQLDQQPWRDLGAAEPALYAERLNIAIPLAQMYARLGQREQALQTLESAPRVALMPALAQLDKDPALASLRDEPRFKAVLEKFRRGAFAARDGLASPYAPTLPLEQRVAGLSLFWSEARHNFANPDLARGLDWDAVYLDYLRKVQKAKSTEEYYAILMRLAPLLQDGHTNIYPPDQLLERFYAIPPLTTTLIEGQVVVEKLFDPQLKNKIAIGDQLVAIDGVATKVYAEKNVRPLASASTPQDSDARTYGYMLLAGDKAKPVALTLRNSAGKHYTVTLKRGARHQADEPRFPFRMLPSGVAYLRIDEFESDQGPKAFEQVLPQIRQAKGLILDLRTNGGGDSDYGAQILSWLVDQPIKPASSRVRYEDQNFRAHSSDYVSWRVLPGDPAPPVRPDDQLYKGPVALLIGPRTYSAAEDFSVMFVQARRGVLVGEATGGSTGQPLFMQLPGGGAARICIKRDYFNDGSDFVGSGIQPDVLVRPTIASLREGSDPALARAEALLSASGQTSVPRKE